MGHPRSVRGNLLSHWTLGSCASLDTHSGQWAEPTPPHWQCPVPEGLGCGWGCVLSAAGGVGGRAPLQRIPCTGKINKFLPPSTPKARWA